MGDIIGLTAVVLIFGVPFIAILTEHRRKVMSMQLEMRMLEQNGSSQQLETLRRELQQLRETTTQYDISVENRLQEMENRLKHVENRTVTSPAAAQESSPIQLGRG